MESNLVKHGPCESCGSSDACAEYDDGHTYCFSCNKVMSDTKPDPIPSGLVEVNCQGIPSRGIRDDTAKRYSYGISGDNQVAQYRDSFGKIVAQKLRGRGKKFSVLGDMSKACLFGQHLSKPGGRHLVITEGELDCLTMSQVQGNKWPCVSIPNGASGAVKAISRNLTWVESFDRIVLAFDQDEPGQKAALDVAALLMPGKASVMKFAGNDPNEMLQQGRSAELVTAFWEAAPYRPEGILSWQEIWKEVADAGPPPASPWNHSGLQRMTDGIQLGSLVTIAAGPASGKSTFVHELVHHFAAAGHRTGVLSLEQSERETVCGLLTPMVGIPLHRVHDLDLHDYDVEAEKLNDMVSIYRHVGKLDAGTLETTARYMAKADKCTHIILDNLSVVVSCSGTGGSNDRQTIDDLLNRLVSLTKETGVTIFLVVHLKRPGQGKGYSEGRPVTLEDMRGSGMIEAMSYTVLSVERDQGGGDPTLATIRLLKCRHTGEAGIAGYMRYDRETGRLSECAAPDEEDALDDF